MGGGTAGVGDTVKIHGGVVTATGSDGAPTSDKGSGGCDAGLGSVALAAIVPALARKRK